MTHIKKNILISIPILFIIGSIGHFIFEFSGRNPFVGLFTPVNESVWEHLKLAIFPILFYWLFIYLYHKNKSEFNKSNAIIAMAISVIFAPLTIVAFYYTYTGAFGISLIILDIFSLFLGITIAQLSALHFYTYSRCRNICVCIALISIVLILTVTIIFTFFPPHIPLFLDGVTKSYGI